MSIKRAATTDLNHDNWDQDDPADHEKMGSFKQAATDVLEKRVIRTAKRRSTQPYAEHQKSVFSGFSGFNKPPPASFDFLANLTNGQSNVKNDSAVSSSFVTSTPLSNNIFMASMTSSENKFNTNSALVKTTPNVFDVSSSTTLNPGSIFTTSIADSTISNSVFKLPTKTTPNDDSTISNSVFKLPAKTTQNDVSISNSVFKLPTKTTASDFKTPFISNNSKPLLGPTQTTPLFAIPSGNIAPFGKETILKEPVTSTSKPQNDLFKQPISGNKNSYAQKNDNEEDVLMFYGSVKKLNETFVEWITINVKNNPICILTPIFDDYVKHINELKQSYLNNEININDPKSVNKSLEKSKKDDIFATAKSNTQQHSIFGIKSTTDSIQEVNTETPHNFQFGVKTSTSPSMATFSASNKNPNEGKNSSSTGNGSIFGFKDKTDTPTVPSNTFNSGPMQQFSFANKSSVTTNTTFSTETINTVGSNPGTQINAPTQSYSFGIKNIPTTSSSLFSFTDKSATPSSSENTPLNTIKTASSFTFGIQNSSKTATDSPTFSFVNKPTMDGSNNEITTAPSLFKNTNTVSKTPFSTDNVSFESKTPLTSISTTTTATPLFAFSNKPAEINTDKSKSSETFSFGTQSTPKTTVDNSISTKSPNFSFGTINTLTSNAENKSVNSQESSFSKNSSFSFTASTLSTPNKVATTSNNSPFGASTDLAPPTFSFTKSPSSNSTTCSSLFGQSSTPFSFGTAKPFSFSPNVEKESNKLVQGEDNEEPPKVEYTPVVEEDCVFEKKCKIFSKKDKNYVDMGVGTLYVKKVTESEKHQLLVRANTNIGTVLLNLILSKDIPCQRMGKNNVMLVCIPTPESKPPPTPMLIRVKSAEEADELLEQLKKFQS